MHRFLMRWGPPLCWATVIFAFSSFPTLPKVEVIWWDFVIKKTAHVIEYAILYFFLLRAFTNTSPHTIWPPKFTYRQWLSALLFGILYAATDELHQSFVPGRTPKITDIGFDTVGMLMSKLVISQHSPSKQDK